MILFLYGTLLDPAVLARMSGEPALVRRLRPARLDGWRRVFLRGTPYPTLVEAAGADVDGAVLPVGPAALARLSAYEGSAYALTPLGVTTARGAVRAQAWIASARRADAARPWP
ncbi:gamma-glutamylcyclotransferase family protein [Roseomonas sp. HF4]|uniref:gamma-glutamylcyclotransferase family protein n=1 Tax=Roseomonas sp. HF4 TaxID=2562313 RepID=UPI0010BFF28F|nr:gamma-glutamylcyclotransferase family protein [Roseomonas sp. HF4]